MKKFKIEVIRTDFYEVEVDENIWTKEELKKWSNVFYPAENQKELAENLANSIMRLGSDYGFIEGFGYVKTFRCDGSQRKHFEGLKEVPDDKYANGISIKIINENDDYEINSYEVK